jgi:hypothetical protein
MCPFPAREGNYVRHCFEPGASGLFGEEAPGPWLSEREALKRYKKIFRLYRLFGDDGVFKILNRRRRWRGLMQRIGLEPGWYDTHAALVS